jgi:hypothetical protein
LFILVSILLDLLKLKPKIKYGILAGIIPVAVAFAFQMIESFGDYEKIWQSGCFLLFPLAGIFSGWISLFITYRNNKKRETMITIEFISPGE